jgi:DsbC/DsbD-like thiol-disulfide interchange protein
MRDTLCIKITMRERNPTSGFSRALTLGVALLLCAVSAHAAAASIPHGTLELITENPWIEKRWIAAGQEFDVGLYFQLEKGWHIYWVNPGDSGEPPSVDWHLPAGLTAGGIEWPIPRRLEGSSSIVDYGYEDAVLLIVPMHAEPKLAVGRATQIGADVKLLVCSHDMCIPGKVQLSLPLPIGAHTSAPHSRYADLFADTRKSFPRPAPTTWKFSVADAKDSFVLSVNLGRQNKGLQITEAVFFPLAESQIENAAAQKFAPVADGFEMTLRKSDQLQKPITRLKGVLVLSGLDQSHSNPSHVSQAYLIDVPVSKPRVASSPGIKIHSA